PGQGLAEFGEARKLAGLGTGAIIGMVAILLAPAVIDSRRLQMAVGVRAKPGVFIGGRKRDRVQAVDLVAIGDALSVGIEIGPVTARPLPADAGFAVAAVPQHGVSRFTRLIDAHKRAAKEGGS